MPHPLSGTAMDLEVKRLGENDPYVDPGKHDRAAAHAAVSKRVSEKGFFPPKTSSDLLGPPFPNMNEGDEKSCVGERDRAFVGQTAPPARRMAPRGRVGCSNTPGVTIGRSKYEPRRSPTRARVESPVANQARARSRCPWGAARARATRLAGRSIPR